jgi:hypothetical protein
VNVVQVKFVVPAGECQSKHVVNELKHISNGMSLGEGLFVFVLDCVVLGIFLLVDYVDDDFFEIFIRKPHVDFAELFFSLVNLYVLDDVFVNQVVVSGDRLQNIGNIDAFCFIEGRVPNQLQKYF